MSRRVPQGTSDYQAAWITEGGSEVPPNHPPHPSPLNPLPLITPQLSPLTLTSIPHPSPLTPQPSPLDHSSTLTPHPHLHPSPLTPHPSTLSP